MKLPFQSPNLYRIRNLLVVVAGNAANDDEFEVIGLAEEPGGGDILDRAPTIIVALTSETQRVVKQRHLVGDTLILADGQHRNARAMDSDNPRHLSCCSFDNDSGGVDLLGQHDG